jgi:hypothetical protein
VAHSFPISGRANFKASESGFDSGYVKADDATDPNERNDAIPLEIVDRPRRNLDYAGNALFILEAVRLIRAMRIELGSVFLFVWCGCCFNRR